MKRILQVPLCILAAFIFFSCQKESASEASNANIEAQVISWLNNQKSPAQPNKAANIDLLSKSLDFAKLTSEKSHDGEKLLIIPIAENYKQEKRIKASSITTLVLKLTRSGDIRDGNVVLYTPKTLATRTIPANTFYAIFNTAEPPCDGEFKFLSVTGRSLYALTYENNVLSKERKVAEKTASSRDVDCIDWYLITTIYYSDGTTSQTEDYIGTTCTGCDSEDMETECPDGSGGGGNPVEYEYEKRRKNSWTVFKNDADTWRVTAWDILKGRGGVFTSITGDGSLITSSSQYNWREDSHSGSFSGTNASSTVSGTFLYPTTGASVFDITNSKNWTYSEVFP